MKIVIFENLLKSEKEKAVEEIINSGYPRQEFYFINIIAASITVLGLIQDNIPVIIGGMILAPMLFPLLTIALTLTTQNFEVLSRSSRTIVMTIILNLIVSIVLSLIFLSEINFEPDAFIYRIQPEIYITLVAFLSGVAAAFSISKQETGNNIAAIAISISLLPPLSAIGIGIATQNMSILINSLSVFGINIVFVVIGAALIFQLMQFKKVKKEVQKAEEEVEEETEKEEKS